MASVWTSGCVYYRYTTLSLHSSSNSTYWAWMKGSLFLWCRVESGVFFHRVRMSSLALDQWLFHLWWQLLDGVLWYTFRPSNFIYDCRINHKAFVYCILNFAERIAWKYFHLHSDKFGGSSPSGWAMDALTQWHARSISQERVGTLFTLVDGQSREHLGMM